MVHPSHVFIIAEAGVNHNGAVEKAKELVDVAAKAGADAVKFQTFKAENVISRFAPKAEYQVKTTGADESQLDMVRKLELSALDHRELVTYCRKRRIEFMSSPFDAESLDLLMELGILRLKVPSGEITNAPFLLEMAETGLPLIMSTGMASLGEVESALSVLAFGLIRAKGKPSISAFQDAFASAKGQAALKAKVILLHCTSEYPSPIEDVNLRAMDTLKMAFGLQVGYSDHTAGITVPIAAVARGASVIEKHFTLKRSLPGPDHKTSLEPNELYSMVKEIRKVEVVLGNQTKLPALCEMNNKLIVRRSLVAAKPIRKGEVFSKENLTAKRPSTGISPLWYWELIGKSAQRDYQSDEEISWEGFL